MYPIAFHLQRPILGAALIPTPKIALAVSKLPEFILPFFSPPSLPSFLLFFLDHFRLCSLLDDKESMRIGHSWIQFISLMANSVQHGEGVVKVCAVWLETVCLQEIGCSPCNKEFAAASLASLGSSPKCLLLLGPEPYPKGSSRQGSGSCAVLGAAL